MGRLGAQQAHKVLILALANWRPLETFVETTWYFSKTSEYFGIKVGITVLTSLPSS